MQRNLIIVGDLRCYVERDTGEERLYRDGRRHGVGGSGRRSRGRNVGNEKLVGADLDYRFLIIQRRDARAG